MTGLALTAAADVFLVKYGAASPADVSLLASVNKPAPPEGDTVTFTVTVTNRGPSSAGQVHVTSVAPWGLSGTTFTPSRGTYNAGSGLWDVGILTNNTAATLTVSATAAQSSPITLTARLTHTDRADTNITNNNASATTDPTLPPGSSLVVTNTQSSGIGSLRNAMEFANSKPNSGGPDVITFAIPVTDPGRDSNGVCMIRPAFPFAPLTEPVIVDGLTQSGASNVSWPPVLKIVIAPSNSISGASGIHISGGTSTVRGLVIQRFLRGFFDSVTLRSTGGGGIQIDGPGGNVITCNFLGTDHTGTNGGFARENDYGLLIVNSPNNRVGGTNVLDRNLFANNDDAGVRIEGTGATNNAVLGNFIGTTVTGRTALENGIGVEIVDAPRNLIGGGDHDAGVCNNGCNLISGNDDEGISVDGPLAVGQRILGNFIGVSITGTNALPNEDYGIVIDEAAGGQIIGGATDPGVCSKGCNVISGNQYSGIDLDDSAAAATIQGNFIGVDVTGMRALPNQRSGIDLESDGNIVGGASPTLRNVISGNAEEGLDFFASDNNIIQGNFIGVAIDGTSPLGNGDDGIDLTGGNSLFGGTNVAERNIIAFNGRNGIGHNLLIGGTNASNRYVGNLIYSNAQMGIDLGLDSFTGNDVDDSDTGGANNQQNYPVLSTIPTITSAGSATVSGTLQSTPSTGFRLEFFANAACDQTKFGEGQMFLGAIQVTTSGGGLATFNQTFSVTGLLAGWFVTATATGPDGTSEFSQCADFPSRNMVTTTADSGAGSLREALAFAKINPGLDTIIFNIPPGDPGRDPVSGVCTLRPVTAFATIDHPVIIDGLTQPGARCDTWPPALKIELDGSLAPQQANGLTFQGAGHTVRGLVINRFANGLVFSGSNSIVQCNFLGTDPTGTIRRGNRSAGIVLGSGDLLGGAAATNRNLISGNSGPGVGMFGSRSNLLQNNFIGTDATGTTNLGNGGPGVNLSGVNCFVRGNLVSGNGLTASPASPNIGSDSSSDCGIFISGADNFIEANFVGTDVTGSLTVSNKGSGIEIVAGARNFIGGTAPGAGNRIAFNGDDGIELQAGFANRFPIANRLLGNSIFSNTRLGIDHGDNGFSSNDGGAGDVDEFWNRLQNFPEITIAGLDTNANQLIIDYRVPSDPLNVAYPLRIEFFRADAANQEGQSLLGADEFTLANFTSGAQRTALFTPASSASLNQRIVATATDAGGNTSEFSVSALLVARQAPATLRIARGSSANTIEFRWPSASTNLQLQCTPSLSPPIDWQPVTTGISDDGTVKSYVVNTSGAATNRFYRLATP